MDMTFKEALDQLLAKLGEELDIPDHIYEDAVLKYEQVGEWLDVEGSALQPYKPEIFPQGSMLLGTTVRPCDDQGEYDIDLVCHLTIKKESITQKDLKTKVGARLKEDEKINRVLEESRRCWRLNYPRQFHLDVLPAIPNEQQPPTGILITDKELRLWQKSNPKAYAEWFHQRMQVAVVRQKVLIVQAESAYKTIEDVPEWKVRTPLQRAVQILKRHRDIYFADDDENRPVSIILTTLAAKAYRNQDNIVDTINDIVRDMPQHIELRDDKWWVENPVEPDENFADKWNEKPERRVAFFRWLKRVQVDFEQALKSSSLMTVTDRLSIVLGAHDIHMAAKSLGIATSTLPTNTSKRTLPYVPPLGDTQHVLQLKEPIQIRYKARISGTVHHPSGKKLWTLTDRPVPKFVLLKFMVSTNTPGPYIVKWQVVNSGEEARAENQLRGDFYESNISQGHVRREPTKFLGTHWVEAFIIKDGVCVAQSGRFYVKVR